MQSTTNNKRKNITSKSIVNTPWSENSKLNKKKTIRQNFLKTEWNEYSI